MTYCPVCGTHGPRIEVGTLPRYVCGGCGLDITIREYLRKLAARAQPTRITFDRATRLYEETRRVVSFGQWLFSRNFQLLGRIG